jgi:hypothetical protein
VHAWSIDTVCNLVKEVGKAVNVDGHMQRLFS